MKAYRERIRNDPLKSEALKEKNRQRMKVARAKQKIEIAALSETKRMSRLSQRRINDRDRQNKRRSKKSKRVNDACVDDDDAIVLTPTKVYNSKQAAGRALSRLRVKLPFSPRKRRAITLKLALDEGNKSFQVPRKQRCATESNEIETKVTEFFNRDDVS